MIINLINTQILAIYLTLFVSSVLIQAVIVSRDGNDDIPERTDSGVLILNQANIENAIDGNELIVVTFCKCCVFYPRHDSIILNLSNSRCAMVSTFKGMVA